LKISFKKLLNNHSTKFLLIILFVSIVDLLFYLIGVFNLFEDKFLDLDFQLRNHKQYVDSNIVFVSIDKKSLDFFDNQGVGWPWPRSFYAKTLEYLNRSEAKAVIFDIDFSNNLNADYSDFNGDSLFRKELSRTKSSFLIGIANKDRTEIPTWLNKYKSTHFCLIDTTGYNGLSYPIKNLVDKNINFGIVNLNPDKDGVFRHVNFNFKIQNSYFPYLPFVIYEKLFGKLKSCEFYGDRYLINWYGKGGTNGVYKYFSIASVILSEIKKEQNLSPIISSSLFRNKIVFVGGTAPGLLDYKITPVTSLAPLPSMEIHATVLNNLIKKDFLYVFPPQIVIIITFFLVAIIFFIFKMGNLKTALILSTIVILLLLIVSFLLFSSNNYLHHSLPLISGIFSVFVLVVLNYFTVTKEKRELKNLFAKYVTPNVVNKLLSDTNSINLSGQEVEATIFFSDIKDFTTISEKFKPSEVVTILNNYFEIVANIILNHNAMLDKYIGDGIMAIFGTPLNTKDHAVQACKTALEIQKEFTYNNRTNVSNSPRLLTRIGLNTGKMIIGNIGTSQRMDYTAVGDSVNIASRLESINKLYGTSIIVSEFTYQLTKEVFIFRKLDLIAVKGKTVPVTIYELVGERNEVEESKLNFILKFEKGVDLFQKREWETAKNIFNELLKKNNDLASRVYFERTNYLLKNPPDEDWNGVYYATVK
jgi:adenylate cyclase